MVKRSQRLNYVVVTILAGVWRIYFWITEFCGGLSEYEINHMIQQIRKNKDIVPYLVRIIIWDQRVIIKERIDHGNPTEIRWNYDLKCFGRSLAKVNWIFNYLIELYLIKIGNQVFLIDKAEYPFSLMKFLMLIYSNLVVPKRVKFCKNES